MRGFAPIPSFPLLVALVTSTCACAHSSGVPGTAREASIVTTDHRGEPAAPPKLDAPRALAKVLELIRTSKGIDDFTPERISEVTGLRMNFDGADRFGAGEQVAAGWNYSFYVNRAALNGPLFMFSFDPSVTGRSPPATAVCAMDFDEFSSVLEQTGFKKDVWYGEHGRIVKHVFHNGLLRIEVGTEGEDDAPPAKLAHQCMRTVIIR